MVLLQSELLALTIRLGLVNAGMHQPFSLGVKNKNAFFPGWDLNLCINTSAVSITKVMGLTTYSPIDEWYSANLGRMSVKHR